MKKMAIRIGAALAVVYLALLADVAVLMRQPPETFGRVMSKAAPIVFLALPFESLWANARAGTLQPGDAAPDFQLQTLDHKSQVKLSERRGRPVALIFGSYT